MCVTLQAGGHGAAPRHRLVTFGALVGFTSANSGQKKSPIFPGFLKISSRLHDTNRLFFSYLERTHGYFRTSARGVATLAGNAFTRAGARATDAPGARRARAAVLSHVSVFILISFSVSAVAETKAAAWLHYTGLQRIIYMPRTRLHVVFGHVLHLHLHPVIV